MRAGPAPPTCTACDSPVVRHDCTLGPEKYSPTLVSWPAQKLEDCCSTMLFQLQITAQSIDKSACARWGPDTSVPMMAQIKVLAICAGTAELTIHFCVFSAANHCTDHWHMHESACA